MTDFSFEVLNNRLREISFLNAGLEVELIQDKPFGTIMIRLNESDVEGGITVIDQKGHDYHFDWHELNPRQRAKLIEDVKQHKILCRVDRTR